LNSGQARLIAASAVALILIAAVGIAGWSQLRSTSRAYEDLVDRDARLTKDALEMKVAVNEQAVSVRGYLLSRGEPRVLEPYRAAVAAFLDELGQARAKAEDPEEYSRLEHVGRQHALLLPVYEREIALTRAGSYAEAVTLARQEGQRAREDLVESLDQLVASEADELYTGRARISSAERTSETAILGVLVLALIAGAIAAWSAWRAARRGAGVEQQMLVARRQAAEEAALARIATAIAHEDQPRAVLASAAEEAAGLLGAASASILRFESGDRSAVVVGSAGPASADAGRRVTVRDDDVLGSCLTQGEPAPTPDPATEPGSDSPLKRTAHGTELAVPIWVGAHAWGAIWVAAAEGAKLDPDSGDRLVRFADLASASITSADARAHLAQLALEDSLTGLANHRHFHERLRAEVARAQRHDRELSVVLFDIDHFKDVNDLHGHHVGDLVLRETAERLAGCARSGELIARVGGEQFGWILPEAGGLDSYRAAERARRLLNAQPMADGVRVSVSAGVCDLEHATSSAELLRFADGALFWAKAHGRDITFRYSPEVVTELSADEQLEHLRRTRTIVGIRALARAVDVKDHSTARHSERVAELSTAIAAALGWDERELAALHEAALVHDVGKIGVPDAILLKPSRLDPDEYETIKQHPALSAEIVNDVLSTEQVSWVLGHHERYDGGGYPDNLARDLIPIGARILAVADAWDVMTSERPYSRTRSRDDALEEVRAQAGQQFCPEVVRALVVVVSGGARPATPAGSES